MQAICTLPSHTPQYPVNYIMTSLIYGNYRKKIIATIDKITLSLYFNH